MASTPAIASLCSLSGKQRSRDVLYQQNSSSTSLASPEKLFLSVSERVLLKFEASRREKQVPKRQINFRRLRGICGSSRSEDGRPELQVLLKVEIRDPREHVGRLVDFGEAPEDYC